MAKKLLDHENIQINVPLNNKEEAIFHTGDLLWKNGYTETGYIDKMKEREKNSSTYMGNNVALPHGSEKDDKYVKKTGISIVTVPEGIDFGEGNIVKIIIGIAGKRNEHLEVLSNIARICRKKSNVQTMINAKSTEEILALFTELNT